MKKVIYNKNFKIIFPLSIIIYFLSYYYYFNIYKENQIIDSINKHSQNIYCEIPGDKIYILLRGHWIYIKETKTLRNNNISIPIKNCFELNK